VCSTVTKNNEVILRNPYDVILELSNGGKSSRNKDKVFAFDLVFD